jgi:hypothetical protein
MRVNIQDLKDYISGLKKKWRIIKVNELSVVINQKPGTIEFNFEELKKNVEGIAEAYEGTDVTEDTTITAKADIATLRKISTAIDDKRKEVKKECLKPYDDFEKKAKELISIISKPILSIDKQVKVFEEKKKAEKKQEIRKNYDALIGDMADYLPFDKIYDTKWENTNVSMKSIKESITQVVDSTSMAVQTIKAMDSEYVSKALEQYKLDLSLPNAIAAINRYEVQRKEILEREAKRKEEKEKKAREEAEAEERRQREEAEEERVLEVERAMQEEHMQKEKERIFEEIKPDDVEEAPFMSEQPFTVEQPFVVLKPKHMYEVVVSEDIECSLIALLESINVTYRRLS